MKMSTKAWHLLRPSPFVGWKSVRKETGVVSARSRGLSELEELQKEKEMGVETTTVNRVDFQRPLKVLSYPDPRLKLPNAKVRLPAEGIEELAKEMFEVMYKDDGIGLAAPQVGVNIQMMVFNPDGVEAKGDEDKEMVLINPKIVKYGKELELFEEGCLSFHRPVIIRAVVERPKTVKVRALSLTGEKLAISLDELPARIFQHEYDHLEGILFFERVTPEVLETLKPDLARYEQEFIKNNPDVEFERRFL